MPGMTSAVSFLAPKAAAFWEIQRFFLERKIDVDAIKEAVIVLAVIVTFLSALLLFISIRNRNKKYIPQDWITDPKEIRVILQNALDQRTKFELQFAAPNGARRPALRCAGVEVRGKTLVLEATGLATLSNRWSGRSAECFFMVSLKEQNMFYAFSSTVENIQVVKNVCFVHVALPHKLEARQKRSYLRIVPPDEYLLGAAVWRGDDLPDESLRGALAGWTKPSLVMLPSVRADFSVRDVSSGGMRVHIPRHALADEMPQFNTSNQLMLMLDLWDPDRMQRLRFWLLCRVQNPVLDFETKGMDLGLQFLAWARPQETEESNSLVWLKLASSGEVEPLGNWIMRRHLEFFRETEHAAKDDGAV